MEPPDEYFFVQKKFLGFASELKLYLKDALFLLFYENMEKYPIINSWMPITEENLKIIIKSNPEIFYFIDDFEKQEEKKNKLKYLNNKINIKNYCKLLSFLQSCLLQNF